MGSSNIYRNINSKYEQISMSIYIRWNNQISINIYYITERKNLKESQGIPLFTIIRNWITLITPLKKDIFLAESKTPDSRTSS